MRRVRRADGREALLQPRIMQVLVAMARARGQILTRDVLTDRCWDGVVVGEDAINRVISRLRRISEELGEGCFAVETIARVGYRLIAVQEFAEGACEPATLAPASPAPGANAPTKPSIAVMPFANLSGDPEQETSPTAWWRRSPGRYRASGRSLSSRGAQAWRSEGKRHAAGRVRRIWASAICWRAASARPADESASQ